MFTALPPTGRKALLTAGLAVSLCGLLAISWLQRGSSLLASTAVFCQQGANGITVVPYSGSPPLTLTNSCYPNGSLQAYPIGSCTNCQLRSFSCTCGGMIPCGIVAQPYYTSETPCLSCSNAVCTQAASSRFSSSVSSVAAPTPPAYSFTIVPSQLTAPAGRHYYDLRVTIRNTDAAPTSAQDGKITIVGLRFLEKSNQIPMSGNNGCDVMLFGGYLNAYCYPSFSILAGRMKQFTYRFETVDSSCVPNFSVDSYNPSTTHVLAHPCMTAASSIASSAAATASSLSSSTAVASSLASSSPPSTSSSAPASSASSSFNASVACVSSSSHSGDSSDCIAFCPSTGACKRICGFLPASPSLDQKLCLSGKKVKTVTCTAHAAPAPVTTPRLTCSYTCCSGTACSIP